MRGALVRRIVVFLSIVAALNFMWGTAADTGIERLVIDQWIVKPATFLIDQVTPEIGVRAVRSSIAAPGGGLNIRAGCDGLDMLFLVIAAFLVAPLRWRARLYGLLLGVLIVYALNQVRILVLFYANRADKSLFDLLHTTALPLILIAFVAMYFYAWLAHDTRHGAQSA